MTQVNSGSSKRYLSLAEAEHCTGLSRDVLRKWELRYQFPLPQRGARGQREYLETDVAKLTLISRLLKQGLRAGMLMQHNTAQLQALLEERNCVHAAPPEPDNPVLVQAVQALLDTLQTDSEPQAVTLFLQQCLGRHGLAVLAAHLMPAFNRAVGKAWAAQQLGIAAEHRYTNSVRTVVLRALPEPGFANTHPRVLLTTPPGELHDLGLLALHAQLALQGAVCINLGLQTPGAEVRRSVRELTIGVVAISISGCLAPQVRQRYVLELLAGLPPDCELWVGGAGGAATELADVAGCRVFSETPAAVQRWLMLSRAQREPMDLKA